MISSIEDINIQLKDPADYDIKKDIFIKQQPEKNDQWHERFLDSNRWLALKPNMSPCPSLIGLPFWEPLWEDSQFASQQFYDKFWRNIACEISQRNLGIVLKTHRFAETIGIKSIIPQCKVTTCVSYRQWQDICKKFQKVPDKLVSSYGLIDEMPLDYPAIRFEIDALIKDEDNFLSQMQSAYDHLGFTDFKYVISTLKVLRKTYLRWHFNHMS